MLCWTPDGTYDLIVHLSIALIDFIIVHLCLACYFSLILICIFIACSHVICTCTFPFIFIHLLGVLTPGFAHQVYACYLADQVFGEDHMYYEEPGVLSIRVLVFLHLFRRFLNFLYIELIACFIFLFICDHV